MISYLVYISSRNNNYLDDERAKILEACKRNNKGLDITGVLLYSSTYFVQFLKSDYRTIIKLYDKRRAYERHINVTMMFNWQS